MSDHIPTFDADRTAHAAPPPPAPFVPPYVVTPPPSVPDGLPDPDLCWQATVDLSTGA